MLRMLCVWLATWDPTLEERVWLQYETSVVEGPPRAGQFFSVRQPYATTVDYYQDPMAYVQHRMDQNVRVDLTTVAVEDWRARRRDGNWWLKGEAKPTEEDASDGGAAGSAGDA